MALSVSTITKKWVKISLSPRFNVGHLWQCLDEGLINSLLGKLFAFVARINDIYVQLSTKK